ncbi:CHASE2 domain-containing protein [Nodosilinea sp. AN01ver1]|uniref:CHASE2 domain-containing protein n=1 Tax=Nodosilinea sp. AN01ver1 TaxID=3423362 RepID=UPI003D3179F8
MTYHLTIHKIDQSCLFELAWGKGQRLTASLAFPTGLLSLYETWRRAYLGYYKQSLQLPPPPPPPPSSLRGRPGVAGQVAAPATDWHSQLVQAEARLLSEFHTWLKHADLFDLREELRRMAEDTQNQALFLTCTPLDLARLPWETWEFGAQVPMVRSPATVRSATANRKEFRRGKARVLAILGDDTGLDFAQERHALNAQRRLLDIHYVGWQPGENTAALKTRICEAIADPQGWDVLFFAGHSNEAALLDGQISIAPHTAIAIKELSPYLRKAQQRGLQFALFNSCSGLDIAQGLVNLGLSQVAVMREPIHNEVAQVFLEQLVQRLARYEDVQTALLGTCQFLKLEQNLTYPSAYLVPSLYRHPESVPYQIQPTKWQTTLHRWRPTPWEATVVGAIGLLSLLPIVQDSLLSQRVWAQAVYRRVTGQLGQASPIVLVSIDDRTIQERGIRDPSPIDRGLLADVVTQLGDLDAPVVGIDYLLDRPIDAEAEAELRQALEQGVEQAQRWFVLVTKRNRNPGADWLTTHPTMASFNWSLEGDSRVPWWHVSLRGRSGRPLPFSYQLAIAHHLSQNATPEGPRPDLQSQTSLEAIVEGYWQEAYSGRAPISQRANLSIPANLSRYLYQRWLHPILDFSLPPDRVYQTIPAWQLLQNPNQGLQDIGLSTLDGQVVMVIAGGYDEVSDDNWPLPAALVHWHGQSGILTGGQAHAYMTHHYLTDHLVMPIPDLWMVLAAAVGSKAIALGFGQRIRRHPIRSRWIFAGGVTGYGWLCLQLYVSGLVLLPWSLPLLTTGLLLLPFTKEKAQ